MLSQPYILQFALLRLFSFGHAVPKIKSVSAFFAFKNTIIGKSDNSTRWWRVIKDMFFKDSYVGISHILYLPL